MVQSPQPVTQWELDVRFVEGLYSQLESLLMSLPFVWNRDKSQQLLTRLTSTFYFPLHEAVYSVLFHTHFSIITGSYANNSPPPNYKSMSSVNSEETSFYGSDVARVWSFHLCKSSMNDGPPRCLIHASYTFKPSELFLSQRYEKHRLEFSGNVYKCA